MTNHQVRKLLEEVSAMVKTSIYANGRLGTVRKVGNVHCVHDERSEMLGKPRSWYFYVHVTNRKMVGSSFRPCFAGKCSLTG
jgi:hypothetical protein